MNKTLLISFSLKNTYRVNSILYSLKQIPVLKKLLPDSLYRVQAFKLLANAASVMWEITATFLWKFLYLFFMVAGPAALYETKDSGALFLHILFLLTLAGAITNTYLFNPTRDKYYAMILMRMNARSYTLVNYTYALLKILVGMMPFAVLLGMYQGVPLWQCIMVPFFIVGAKLIAAAYTLWDYKKHGESTNENKLSKLVWLCLAVLLAAAYGLPAIHVVLPTMATVMMMGTVIIAGALCMRSISSFPFYREMYQQLLNQSLHQMDSVKEVQRTQSLKTISNDVKIVSRKTGFEYLNELFIKRHQKILWKASKRLTAVCLCVIAGALLFCFLVPESKEYLNHILLTYLPFFVFIMYGINRGTGFTRALFMNCDHSLLTYSFYKQPKFVLRLFQIRLWEIMKINLLPAVVLGIGMAVVLYLSGGTGQSMNYIVLIVSIPCLSIFFSVHYLTIYYLLQPYNAGTEIKSGTYQVVLGVTYFVCFYLTKIKMSTFAFGIGTIVFCLLYCVVACILIYFLAPKTFRLRT